MISSALVFEGTAALEALKRKIRSYSSFDGDIEGSNLEKFAKIAPTVNSMKVDMCN